VAKRDRFEQDIIIFERVPLPAGWDPAALSPRNLDGDGWRADARQDRSPDQQSDGRDSRFRRRAHRIGSGRAFILEDPQGNTSSFQL